MCSQNRFTKETIIFFVVCKKEKIGAKKGFALDFFLVFHKQDKNAGFP
jgi:hypothetical protein